MIVIADTTPINYLILIEEIDVLQTLYQRVILPVAVQEELLHPATPLKVRSWVEQKPAWIDVRRPAKLVDSSLAGLDPGEREAILLAEELAADQIILDELRGRREAKRRGLLLIGTLGVLVEAASLGLVDLQAALTRLRQTSFHISPDLLKNILGN